MTPQFCLTSLNTFSGFALVFFAFEVGLILAVFQCVWTLGLSDRCVCGGVTAVRRVVRLVNGRANEHHSFGALSACRCIW